MSYLFRTAKTSDAESLAEVHVESWNARYRGMLPDHLLENPETGGQLGRWRRILTSDQPGRFILVAAQADEQVAGFISAGIARSTKLGFDSEIYALYVASPYWRQRLGLRLMAAAAQRLQLFGHQDLMLWALEDNTPARRFYERLGGAIVAERIEKFNGEPLREIAYGWRKLSMLITICAELPQSQPSA